MLYQAENPHGGDRYGRAVELDFSVNTNPLGTPPAVRPAAGGAAGRGGRTTANERGFSGRGPDPNRR